MIHFWTRTIIGMSCSCCSLRVSYKGLGWINFLCFRRIAGLDINVCPIPVKTDVGQVDLVLRLSNGTSEKIRDSQTCRYDRQIYFHWYKILGLLYKRAMFDLQFVHNLFWLKLKWNARSKLFYCRGIVPPCFDEVQGHWQN